MNSLKFNICNELKGDSLFINKKRKSLCQRKSIRLLKDAKLKLQIAARNTRHAYIGDRIIAHRGVMDFSQSEDILMCRANEEHTEISDDLSVSNLIVRTILPGSGRLLKLSSKHKSPSYENKIRALYEKNKCNDTSKRSRHISIYPERILDAPMVSTEFWNIIDLNRKGILAVALGNTVYLWHSSGGNVEELVKDSDSEDFGCVKWLDDYDDNVLAVGSHDGKLTLWKSKRLYRTIYTQSSSKITTVACKKTMISIGFASGLIQHYDLKSITPPVSINEHHKKPITQMKWSASYVYLAVASKDGTVSVWSGNRLSSCPVADFRENSLGIDDVAWSPRHESHLLFAGGEDNRVLKIVDVQSRACVRSLNSDCRMSMVFWSATFHEVAVTTFAEGGHCRLRLYSEGALKMVIELTGHRGHIMALIGCPSTGALATVGGDESIRLWNCFNDEDVVKMREEKRGRGMSLLDGFDRIR